MDPSCQKFKTLRAINIHKDLRGQRLKHNRPTLRVPFDPPKTPADDRRPGVSRPVMAYVASAVAAALVSAITAGLLGYGLGVVALSYVLGGTLGLLAVAALVTVRDTAG